MRTEAELPAAIEAALDASRNGAYIVEEYVDGPEVTVNAVSVDGVFHPLLVTDRLTADPPAFGVALAHVWPCVSETQSPIEAARAAAEALGVGTGRRTRRSGSERTDPAWLSWLRASAAATTPSSSRPRRA